MSLGPSSGAPAVSTWTIRFKYHKTTALLHVDPMQDFDEIKKELVTALRQTHPDGMVEGRRIPDSTSDVLIARPVDIFDLSKGWIQLQTDDAFIEEAEQPRKKNKAGSALPDACPKLAGLKENAVVAFKFRMEDEDEGLGLEDQPWDVVVPSFEDSAGAVGGDADD